MSIRVYWALLLAVALIGIVARFVHGSPLFPRRALRLHYVERAVAIAALLALGFHCAAMFFSPVVDAIPGLQGPASAIRALGPVSQIAYWAPAVIIVIALRRVWLPAIAAESAALLVVGITMFGPFALAIHLAAIAAAIAVMVAVGVALVYPGSPRPETA